MPDLITLQRHTKASIVADQQARRCQYTLCFCLVLTEWHSVCPGGVHSLQQTYLYIMPPCLVNGFKGYTYYLLTEWLKLSDMLWDWQNEHNKIIKCRIHLISYILRQLKSHEIILSSGKNGQRNSAYKLQDESRPLTSPVDWVRLWDNTSKGQEVMFGYT